MNASRLVAGFFLLTALVMTGCMEPSTLGQVPLMGDSPNPQGASQAATESAQLLSPAELRAARFSLEDGETYFDVGAFRVSEATGSVGEPIWMDVALIAGCGTLDRILLDVDHETRRVLVAGAQKVVSPDAICAAIALEYFATASFVPTRTGTYTIYSAGELEDISDPYAWWRRKREWQVEVMPARN